MHPITTILLRDFRSISAYIMYFHASLRLGNASKIPPILTQINLELITFFSFISALDTLLQEHDIELSLITLNWFLTLYSSVLHIRIIMRLWDLFLFDGSRILFQVAIAMLKLHEDELLKADNSAEIFNILSTIPSR